MKNFRWPSIFAARFFARLFAVSCLLFLLVRTVFAVWTWRDMEGAHAQLWKSFLVGTVFDVSTIVYMVTPLALVLALFPAKLLRGRGAGIVLGILGCVHFSVLLFSSLSEFFFFEELKARFNFIAVDYLVYTTEVVRNIWESYPIVWISAAIVWFAGIFAWAISSSRAASEVRTNLGWRPRAGLALSAAVCFALNLGLVNQSYSEVSSQFYVNETAKNGINSIFAAYFSNQIDYKQFYATRGSESIDAVARPLLEQKVVANARDKKLNVVMVVMESMSAKFMAAYGNNEKITPNLDSLADKGLFFHNMYATGTRTVRGLEALMLSVPPTPGQSIVRRPNSDGLFNISTVFREHGYDTSFLYGGYAIFDNMKAFFASNGMRVLDQGNISSSKVTFSNAWGMCDADIYSRSLLEADKLAAAGTPFFQVVLTTSNHRPFTYPQVIDMPSGNGRTGAIKYSDYAIGEFVEKARTRKWFDDTVFVFVADHNASVAGSTEVAISDYKIPAIIYSPRNVPHRRVDKLASQIDMGPTLLSLVGLSYERRFYGQDLLAPDALQRAYISNYQRLGYMTPSELVLLGPKKKIDRYRVDDIEQTQPLTSEGPLVDAAIDDYQSADLMFRQGCLKEDARASCLEAQ